MAPWWWKDVRMRSLVLVCLASILERADEALLPSVYREIGIALNASPSALGSLTLVRSLMQALCAPLAGFLAQHYNRASIIAGGAVMWAVATFFVGISETFSEVALSRALNGIGLAVVVPSIQSMVADATDETNRGKGFGWLMVAGNVGSMLGGFFAVLMASTEILGIDGWRMAFHLVAFLSMIVAGLVYSYAVDPQFSGTLVSKAFKDRTFMDNLKEIWLDTKSVLHVKSFQVFVAQGVAGSFPWAALAFAPMWLELVGFSHTMTAALMGCFVVACSIGALFGGWAGDRLSIRLPNTGRIMLSQISAGLGVPLGAVLLLLLPSDPSTPVVHGLAFFIMGLCISWNGSATNGPIFAEIVPEKSRTNVYALDRAFETVLASFAPPIVGLLAENLYGYVPPPSGDGRLATDRSNAVALAKALYTSTGIPFVLCSSIYTLLYWTYPDDRDRVRESNMQFQSDTHIRLDVFNSKDSQHQPLEDVEDVEDEQRKHDSDNVSRDVAGETVRMLPKDDQL
ncbi:hypothetical protein AXG93_488s1050 [Marchantia polymorpha subsp. ruderalis]|uniref:Major facilitator superfamily (MFS) profile domain-containing protein n=1 Tax=Marchantia polymorpha subsp. ruderalis TaxID=1480154 RepID=A0A176W5W9_MARPO|nr:hypothetical protein AXG93_488s1050 [Marchantia polymorpha subsp. ruderalis]